MQFTQVQILGIEGTNLNQLVCAIPAGAEFSIDNGAHDEFGNPVTVMQVPLTDEMLQQLREAAIDYTMDKEMNRDISEHHHGNIFEEGEEDDLDTL